MTITEIQNSDKLTLTAQDIAPVLGKCAQAIREQAYDDPSKLGFPVIAIKRTVQIPRIPFLLYMGMEIKG